MEKKFKWTLKTNAKKMTCPNCGHKTFVPFVLASDQTTLAPLQFGRCDRQENCRYFLYPDKKTSKQYKDDAEFVEVPKLPPSFIPYHFVADSEKLYTKQNLFNAFLEHFTAAEILAAFKRYHVGTTKRGATIFWQIDDAGNVRTGKVMNYLTDGHRDKNDFGTWIHRILKLENFNLEQCFFGSHLIRENLNVGIVESEKTAIFMSIIAPGITWLATGGSGNVQSPKFFALKKNNCKITLYPDKGMEQNWISKVNNLATVKANLYKKDAPKGIDILDVYLFKECFK